MVGTVYGISGYARVGKDSFAEILAREIFERSGNRPEVFSFARSLKKIIDPFLIENFGISAFTQLDEKKKIIRPMLVGFGESARNISQNFWINKIAPDVKQRISSGLDVIITDVRYQNEAWWVKSFDKSKVIGLIRHGVFAPNKEESESIPQVFELADQIIQWPVISPSQESSVLDSEELRRVVKSTILD